jgi:hypothetical protein
MNLIPIPALDGGKLILNLLEGILRQPLPQSFENAVTIVGRCIYDYFNDCRHYKRYFKIKNWCYRHRT